jgi:hypothetical protein
VKVVSEMSDYVYLWQDRTNRTLGVYRTVQDLRVSSASHAEPGDRIEKVEIGHIDAFQTIATFQPWGWDLPELSDSPDVFDMPGMSDMPTFPSIRT